MESYVAQKPILLVLFWPTLEQEQDDEDYSGDDSSEDYMHRSVNKGSFTSASVPFKFHLTIFGNTQTLKLQTALSPILDPFRTWNLQNPSINPVANYYS